MRTSVLILLAVTGMVRAGGLAGLPHPRLWFAKDAEPALRESIARDPLRATLQRAALKEADAIIKERTCRHEIPDGKRLLGESRRAMRNVLFSAWAWRTTGQTAYRDRAILEIEAACALKDWNPSHYLDTAEMATAVAIGYDWLYQDLNAGQRAACERALVERALKTAKKALEEKTFWAKPKNNWSQVCGAGIGLAAAAVAGHDEGLAEDFHAKCLDLVTSCGRFYQPDGMYVEGPGYWQYGTSYQVALMAACDMLGEKTPSLPELAKGGTAMMHLTSPNRLTFNFADGGADMAVPSAAQCWIAARYRDPVQSTHVRNLLERVAKEDPGRLAKDRFFPLAVLWLPKPQPQPSAPPLAAFFAGEQPVACLRTGWNAADAYLAAKGGTPGVSHGHMDVGAFVYDALGIRWFHDLGAENYNLPGYFGKARWSYYRLQNRSHNTLEIDGRLHVATCPPCPLTTHRADARRPSATFDLTHAYAGAATKVTRTAALDTATGAATLTDTIEQPVGEIVWRAFTDATVTLTAQGATLAHKGKSITVRQTTGGGVWSVANATPPTDKERSNKEFRALTLTLPRAERVTITVEIHPR